MVREAHGHGDIDLEHRQMKRNLYDRVQRPVEGLSVSDQSAGVPKGARFSGLTVQAIYLLLLTMLLLALSSKYYCTCI